MGKRKNIGAKAFAFIMVAALVLGSAVLNVSAADKMSVMAGFTNTTAVVGEEVELKYELTNEYSGTITNVSINRSNVSNYLFFSEVEFLQDTVEINGISSANFVYDDTNKRLTINVGDIPAGQTTVVTFKVKVLVAGEIDLPAGNYKFRDPDGVSRAIIGGSTSVTVLSTKYVLTYNANGGTGTAPEAQEFSSGDTVAVAANTFTAPTNKVFKEWNTKEDGLGDNYAAGSNMIVAEENVVLYAIWEDKQTTPGEENTPGDDDLDEDEGDDKEPEKIEKKKKDKDISNKGGSSKTGDENSLVLPLALMSVGGLGFVALMILLSKKLKQN